MVMARIFLVGCNYRVLAKRMQIAVYSHCPHIRLLRTLCTVGRIAQSAAIPCHKLLRFHVVSTTFTTPYTILALSANLSANNALSVNLSANNASPANGSAPLRHAECRVRLCASIGNLGTVTLHQPHQHSSRYMAWDLWRR
jgi:hypothetical protein